MTNRPDARMLIIVPTRSRPENVAKVVRAWEDTDAFRYADLCFAYDRDDPKYDAYRDALNVHHALPVLQTAMTEWRPLVPKLNIVARWAALDKIAKRSYFAIGFAGDDHLPRTPDWAPEYLLALKKLGTGVVSCPDGYRPDRLPTQWAMTADIVRALGRMVPAPVEHLYCDNAVWDLAEAAGCYAYLDDVLIEHMHPLAGKTKFDDQYRHVNRPDQYRQDGEAYEEWKRPGAVQFRLQVNVIQKMRALRLGSTAPKASDSDSDMSWCSGGEEPGGPTACGKPGLHLGHYFDHRGTAPNPSAVDRD